MPHLSEQRQQPQLAVDSQVVAALGLDGGDALKKKSVEPPARSVEELLVAGVAGGAHRRQDAAARLLNLQVRLALRAQIEFVGARPGEDGVRVRLHQAGRDQSAACVNLPHPGIGRASGAGVDHAPAANGDAGLLEEVTAVE